MTIKNTAPDLSLPVHVSIHELVADADLTGVELLRRIRTLANLYDTILNQRLRQADLSGPRLHLLVRIFAEELKGGPDGLSPTYLSRCQSVSKNTMSALLRGLEQQGLVERTLDAVDRRIFRIRLSEAGRELVRSRTPQHLAELNDLAAGLARSDRARLIELLDELHRSLLAHAEPAGQPAWSHTENPGK